jgi:hypothetical protein
MPKLTTEQRILLEQQAADAMLAALRAEFGPRFSDGYLQGVVRHRMNQVHAIGSLFATPAFHRDLERAIRGMGPREREPEVLKPESPKQAVAAILERWPEQHNHHSINWRYRKQQWKAARAVEYRWDVGEQHVLARCVYLAAEKQRKKDEQWQRRIQRRALHEREYQHCYDNGLDELAHDFYPEEDDGHWFPFLEPMARPGFQPTGWFDWRRGLMTREFNRYRRGL